MTERREPLSVDERALLRRRAAGVVPVAIGLGAVVVGVLGWGFTEFSATIRVLFGCFFGGILAMIVGIHVGAAFEVEKLVRRGVVTDKRVAVSPASTSSGTRGSTRHYLSLDGQELSVEAWVHARVHTGQTVELRYTARLQNLFDVEVLDDPASAAAQVVSAKPFDPGEMAHTEALTASDRAVLGSHLLRAAVRRGAGGALVAGGVYTAIVVGWALGRVAGGPGSAFDAMLVTAVAPGLALLTFALVNRQTVRLFQDRFGDRRNVATERVVDVMRSNTPLLGPRIVVSGTGLAGDFAWVQTAARWVQLDPSLVGTAVTGAPLEVVTAPRSGVVLAVGGVAAPAVRLGLVELLVIVVGVGVAACLSSGPAPAAP